LNSKVIEKELKNCFDISRYGLSQFLERNKGNDLIAGIYLNYPHSIELDSIFNTLFFQKLLSKDFVKHLIGRVESGEMFEFKLFKKRYNWYALTIGEKIELIFKTLRSLKFN
jgi:hypothetical protein